MVCCLNGPISFIKKHWSLVIIFAAMIHCLFFGGFIFSYNLLYLELRKSFNSTATETGLLAAPWIEWLYEKYSWRNTLRIISGCLALVGYSTGLVMIDMKPTHVKLSIACEKYENDKCSGGPICDSSKDGDNIETYTQTHSNKEVYAVEKKMDTKFEVDLIRNKSCIAKYIAVLKRRDFTISLPGILLAATATMFTYISVGNFLFEAGMDNDHIALVIVWMGIGDLTGRIIAAVFSDGLPISRTFQYALSNVVAAAPSVALPFISSSSGLTAALIIMSVPRAILNVLLPSVAMEISSDETRSEAVALIYMAFGAGTFITPYLTDTLFDNTGSYVMPWFICTTLYLISAVFLLLAVYAKRKHERTSIQKYDRVEKDDCEIAKTELK
ncbi:uncharacterized protein LOC117109494 isoform X2 [Anneissia japonica]|uniref:uncharacterized protein LOC117109494 isoform X2 n=1 Tax=Anneissia japonica TaxID=1529436 RepID=UPI0014259B17|nr:uncharacterized protein LOC117109494 isoform X2 [Anneissia japonica]